MDELFAVRRMVAQLRETTGSEVGGLEFAELTSSLTEWVSEIGRWLEERGLERPPTMICRLGAARESDAALVRDLGPLGSFRLESPAHGPIWLQIDVAYSFGHDHHLVVAAYRERAALEWLLGELRAVGLRRKRKQQLVIVGVGEPGPLPRLGWDDVFLPGRTKREIREGVEDFSSGRERCARFRIPWRRGLLLVGPPGNGKTMLCKVIAATSGMPFVSFRPTCSTDDDDVEVAFTTARELSPAVLCVEDVDSLFRTQATLSHFLNRMDGMGDNTGLLVLATTNHPEALDRALLQRPSRFDRVWRLGDPDHATRLAYLAHLFHDLADAETIRAAAEQTGGFSMAFLHEVKVAACMRAGRQGRDALVPDDVLGAVEILRRQIRVAASPEQPRPVGFGASDDREDPSE